MIKLHRQNFVKKISERKMLTLKKVYFCSRNMNLNEFIESTLDQLLPSH